jgi:hypothetical protein
LPNGTTGESHTARRSLHSHYALVQTVAIAGYTRPIEQPYLGQLDGQPVLAKMGDDRLQLTNEQLREMGDKAAQIVSALARCASPPQIDFDWQ